MLQHLTDHVTRLEVHLSDQNADKAGPDDIQCKIEVRIKQLKPITVVSKGDKKEVAIDVAMSKIKASLTTTIGKLKKK